MNFQFRRRIFYNDHMNRNIIVLAFYELLDSLTNILRAQYLSKYSRCGVGQIFKFVGISSRYLIYRTS